MTAQARLSSDVLPRGAAAHVRRSRPDWLPVACRPTSRPGGTGLRAAAARLVVAGGDLRAPDSAALRARLAAAHRPGTALVLDLSGVVSIDAAVVGVLVAADRRLRPTGAGVVLVGARPRVARALGVAGAARLLAA